jgi:23S rRNA G2445 N2-methylase RlmL
VKSGLVNEKELEKFDKKKEFKGRIIGMDREVRHVENSKKNAKIAGIEKDVEFSRSDIEWFETKFEDDSVDFIVTDAPKESRRMAEDKVRKIYYWFFHQAKFILKKSGRICVVNNSIMEEEANKEGFVVEKKVNVEKNSQAVEVAAYKKQQP